MVKDLNKSVRRITCLYDLFLDEHDEVRMIRRVQKNAKKKKKKFLTAPVFKYGIEVPRNLEHAKRIDASQENTYWEAAFGKEVKALLDLDCFEFHQAGYHENLGSEWQRTSLHMVFDVKQDLTRKRPVPEQSEPSGFPITSLL